MNIYVQRKAQRLTLLSGVECEMGREEIDAEIHEIEHLPRRADAEQCDWFRRWQRSHTLLHERGALVGALVEPKSAENVTGEISVAFCRFHTALAARKRRRTALDDSEDPPLHSMRERIESHVR